VVNRGIKRRVVCCGDACSYVRVEQCEATLVRDNVRWLEMKGREYSTGMCLNVYVCVCVCVCVRVCAGEVVACVEKFSNWDHSCENTKTIASASS
jgi:hypothetical protein